MEVPLLQSRTLTPSTFTGASMTDTTAETLVASRVLVNTENPTRALLELKTASGAVHSFLADKKTLLQLAASLQERAEMIQEVQ